MEKYEFAQEAKGWIEERIKMVSNILNIYTIIYVFFIAILLSPTKQNLVQKCIVERDLFGGKISTIPS